MSSTNYCVLVAIICCTLMVNGQSDFTNFDHKDVLSCALEQGLTSDVIQSIPHQNPQEVYEKSPQARCFLACVLRKMGQFVGDPDTQITQSIREKFGILPELRVDDVIKQCTPDEDAVEEKEGCMREYRAFMCFVETLKKNGEEVMKAEKEREALGNDADDDITPVDTQPPAEDEEDEINDDDDDVPKQNSKKSDSDEAKSKKSEKKEKISAEKTKTKKSDKAEL